MESAKKNYKVQQQQPEKIIEVFKIRFEKKNTFKLLKNIFI